MMLKPEISKLLEETKSPYRLVVAVAKRSRDISEEALEEKRSLDDKAVNIAIDEFCAKRVKVADED